MFARLGQRLAAVGRVVVQHVGRRLSAATKPSAVPLAVGTLADLPRDKRALMAQTGHKSQPPVRRCIRGGSLFREDTAAEVGL